ncbi:MAG TPA: outer membrane beta-barrel protein [Gammaproteobacteria bacterium]|nr:outer membrane beta-barrel protein [Gammaproteobacteria bacterium]
MKKNRIIYAAGTLLAASISMESYAVAPGLYLGLMLGPATNSGSKQQAQIPGSPLTTTVSPRSNQFGTRVFLGYQINQYAAWETGLTYFSNINYNSYGVPTCSNPQVKVRDFDILGKGILPFGNAAIFGKGGVAFAYVNSSGTLNPNGSSACSSSDNETKIRPSIAVGASYDLSQNWVTDISWNRILLSGITGNIDYYTVGISYHFVDKYCGQFLCDD